MNILAMAWPDPFGIVSRWTESMTKQRFPSPLTDPITKTLTEGPTYLIAVAFIVIVTLSIHNARQSSQRDVNLRKLSYASLIVAIAFSAYSVISAMPNNSAVDMPTSRMITIIAGSLVYGATMWLVGYVFIIRHMSSTVVVLSEQQATIQPPPPAQARQSAVVPAEPLRQEPAQAQPQKVVVPAAFSENQLTQTDCQHCGKVNPVSNKYCGQCGKLVTGVECPSCKRINPSDIATNNCHWCKKPINPEPVPEQKPDIKNESLYPSLGPWDD